MKRNERIILDACLISVIDNYAFDAELRNGHRFVAFIGRNSGDGKMPKVGEQISVEFSPYDMSKGCLVLSPGAIK